MGVEVGGGAPLLCFQFLVWLSLARPLGNLHALPTASLLCVSGGKPSWKQKHHGDCAVPGVETFCSVAFLFAVSLNFGVGGTFVVVGGRGHRVF